MAILLSGGLQTCPEILLTLQHIDFYISAYLGNLTGGWVMKILGVPSSYPILSHSPASHWSGGKSLTVPSSSFQYLRETEKIAQGSLNLPHFSLSAS